MILLPLALADMHKLCSDYTSRFGGIAGVHVQCRPDGSAVVSATDTKVAVLVTTQPDDVITADTPNDAANRAIHPDNFPVGMPSGHTPTASAIIPAAWWRDTFAAAKKVTKRCARPILKMLGVVISPDAVTAGATDTETTLTPKTRHVAGCFPPLATLVDDAKRTSRLAFSVDAALLGELLAVLNTLGTSDKTIGGRVTFMTNGPETPILVRVENPVDGIASAVGLIQPLGVVKGATYSAWDDGTRAVEMVPEPAAAELAAAELAAV